MTRARTFTEELRFRGRVVDLWPSTRRTIRLLNEDGFVPYVVSSFGVDLVEEDTRLSSSSRITSQSVELRCGPGLWIEWTTRSESGRGKWRQIDTRGSGPPEVEVLKREEIYLRIAEHLADLWPAETLRLVASLREDDDAEEGGS